MEKYNSNSYEETIKIATEFAKSLKAGDVVLLYGDLGAGKTVFSKGVVSEISSGKCNAVSPTFVIMNEYSGKFDVYHFDLYRLSDPSELEMLGVEEYFYSRNGICLVEWPERAEGIYPGNSIKVEIKKTGDDTREITIQRGKEW